MLGGFAWEGRMSGAPARALEEHRTMARAQHCAHGYVGCVGCVGYVVSVGCVGYVGYVGCAGARFETDHNDA